MLAAPATCQSISIKILDDTWTAWSRTYSSKAIFSARCNIYISLLCYDASVRLSVMFVHCGHRVQWIPDIFACLDNVFATYWQRLTWIVGWDNAGISGGSGGYGKIGNCSDITYFTYWESGPETCDMFICLYQWYVDIFIIVRVISVENALYLKNGLC